LRPFSVDEQGYAIHLFNIKREKCIATAPVKGQCARDYYYGEDGLLEHILQGYEGRYATIVREIKQRSGTNPSKPGVPEGIYVLAVTAHRNRGKKDTDCELRTQRCYLQRR
jgi:hypothetical protein